MAQAPPADRELNKATVRVLSVLSTFAADVSGFGVTELSHVLGMTKNMTYRALATLVEQGYLMREADSARYQLGYRILELQSDIAIEPDFRTLCGPYIARLQALTGESVSLAVRALDYCVMIDGIETRRPGVWRVRIGDVLPLFGPASGRVMLAFTDDAAIEDYIARNRPMRHPRTQELLSPDELRGDIARTRRDGYVWVKRASNPPMVSVGLPVRDLDGGLHGTISVGGPSERCQAQLERQMPEVIAIIDELNRRSRLFSANATGSEFN